MGCFGPRISTDERILESPKLHILCNALVVWIMVLTESIKTIVKSQVTWPTVTCEIITASGDRHLYVGTRLNECRDRPFFLFIVSECSLGRINWLLMMLSNKNPVSRTISGPGRL